MTQITDSLFEPSQFPMANIKHDQGQNQEYGYREDNA